MWHLPPHLEDLFARPSAAERFSHRVLMLSGTPAFRQSLKERAAERGLRLDPLTGLLRRNEIVACGEAAELDCLGLGWVPPASRYLPLPSTETRRMAA